MPQVASDAVSSAYKPAVPPAREASYERAPDTPFESLLDAGTETASAPPPAKPAPAARQQQSAAPVSQQSPTPAADTANIAQPHPVQPVATGDNGIAAPTTAVTGSTDNAVTPDPTAIVDAAQSSTTATTTESSVEQTAAAVIAATVATTAQIDAKATKAFSTGEAKTKTGQQAADGSKPCGNDKQVGDNKPADTAAASLSDSTNSSAQTGMPAVAVAAVPAPAVTITPAKSQGNQAAPTPGKIAASAAGQQAQAPAMFDQAATTAAADAAKPDTAGLAPAQGDSDKPAVASPRDLATAPSRASTQASTATLATDAQAAAPQTTGDAARQPPLIVPSSDASQTAANTTTTAASAAPATQTTQAAPAAVVPISGVAVEIASMAQAGNNRLEIRLDPPELGRIEVRLDVDRDGRVTSRLIADRSDTLNLLQSDSSGLERALQNAGLKTADNGLQFSLRDQSSGQQQQAATSNQSTAQIVVPDSTLPAASASQSSYSRLASLRGGVDIRV